MSAIDSVKARVNSNARTGGGGQFMDINADMGVGMSQQVGEAEGYVISRNEILSTNCRLCDMPDNILYFCSRFPPVQ